MVRAEESSGVKAARGGSARSELTLHQALEALGLDVAYERGEGSRLWYRAPEPRSVWDFLGGYGSTFFGHNQPDLVQAAHGFLESGGVTQGQASVRLAAERLTGELTRRLDASCGARFEVVLASTGSEAVEVAARHAEEALEARRASASSLVEPCAAAGDAHEWTPSARELVARLGIDPRGDLLRLVDEHNQRVLSESSVHIAVERAYHGMTARARSLTDDLERRFGHRLEALRVLFVDPSDPDSVGTALQTSLGTLLRVRREQGRLGLDALRWSPCAALFLEPIQGEGGIRPLTPEVARAWRLACNEHGIPLVADEIQSGLGRTGTFLHCEQLGIRPDYVVLGKSLGGGLAKMSAVGIESSQFLPGFTLRYASTFAADDLSCTLALRALALLDEHDALRVAQEKGELLLRRLRELARRHPGVIAEARGAGLMLGLEWRPLDFDRSHALFILQEYGWLGYALASFLLHEHGVRVAPTLAGHRTIRIEPSFTVPEEAIERLLEGLEDLCRLLETQDSARLLAACLGTGPPTRRRVEPIRRVVTSPTRAHVGFVGHFIEPEDLTLWDSGLARLPVEACGKLLERIYPLVEPVVTHREPVRSATGQEVTLTFIGLAVASQTFYRALRTAERRALRKLVRRGVELAAAEGCSVVGLGGYSSIVTRNGRDVGASGVAITTGNAYTVGAGLEAMRAAGEELGLELRSERVAVVGATGNIGAVLAELLAFEAGALTLVGRPSRVGDLQRLALRLADTGNACEIDVATDVRACSKARYVATASNQARPILLPEHVSEGPVVIADFSVPADVHPSVSGERPNARLVRGGIVRTPGNPGWRLPGVPLAPGEMYACMTETVLMGLEEETTHGSYGALTPDRVRRITAMAARHGFSSVRAALVSSY